MKIVILDSYPADQGTLDWNGLSASGEVVSYAHTTNADLRDRAADADALITNKVVLDAPVLADLPRLRYVGIVATGTNCVDLAVCRERGIAVTNVPGYSTRSVAQLVFALILHLTHDVAGHDSFVKRGGWAAARDFSVCLQPLVELADKTLVVVGLGAIGESVAAIGRAMGMRVIAAHVPGTPARPERVSLAEALPKADVVTLHCPLTPATRGLVGDEFLRAMKRSAILVNTGRGPLVDERAIAVALADGHLGGLALDVLTDEPPAADHPLLDPKAPWARRVVVTPHIGWATVEARKRLITAVCDNLAAFCRGKRRNRVESAPAND